DGLHSAGTGLIITATAPRRQFQPDRTAGGTSVRVHGYPLIFAQGWGWGPPALGERPPLAAPCHLDGGNAFVTSEREKMAAGCRRVSGERKPCHEQSRKSRRRGPGGRPVRRDRECDRFEAAWQAGRGQGRLPLRNAQSHKGRRTFR